MSFIKKSKEEKALMKILGASPSAPTPTYSFSPAVPLEPPPYMKFVYKLQELGYVTQWYGPTLESDFTSAQHTCTVKMSCPHGETLDQQVSLQILNTENPAGLAEVVMQQFRKLCEYKHANTPPPGQFVYSYASSEPIAYASNNVLYKMEDFKKQYGEEYVKMLESQSQSYYTGASIGGPFSGGISYSGTSSILTELLSICPGLGKVQRTCPEAGCVEWGKAPLLLSMLIQHVNDRHQWSREKIAEWLDIIAIEDPTVDLTIKPKEKKREQPSIGPSQEDYEKIIGYGSLSLSADALKGLYEGILGSNQGVD